MAGFSWLPDYDADKTAAAQKIGEKFGPLKIILKTKNETELLRGWIQHHQEIVGLENIIIFDHNSDDVAVERIYKEYIDYFPIFKYSGFVDIIHQHDRNRDLYQNIQESCSYYIFLDTDEYLTLYRDDKFYSDSKIVKFVLERDLDVYPGVWLQNVLGFNDYFLVQHPSVLEDGLKWGKPVIKSGVEPANILLHNVQVTENTAPSKIGRGLFVLHRSFLSPNQRIKSNLYKLMSHNVIKTSDGVEAVLNINIDDIYIDNCRRYISEIVRLSSLPANSLGDLYGTIKIDDCGDVTFYSEDQKMNFESFLRGGQR